MTISILMGILLFLLGCLTTQEELLSSYEVEQINILIGFLEDIVQMCRMSTVFNWFSRRDSFLAMGFCSLLTTLAAAIPLDKEVAPYVYMGSGLLLVAPLPLLQFKFYHNDPLDAGVVINEQA